MTLDEYIDKISKFRDESGCGKLDVVFHDADGSALGDFDICQDGTCADEDVVRITLVENEDEA